MPLRDLTVLVTGGTGFIGGRLVEKLFLEQSAHVRALVRDFSRASRIARFPVEMVAGNTVDERSVEAALQDCDVVFHCAYDFGKSRQQQQRVAIQGTETVARAVLKCNVKRLVYVSTISVYEPTVDGDLDETAPEKPCGWTYADTKLAAEQLVLEYHRRYGLPVAVLQPAIVYGPFARAWTIGPVRQLKDGRVVLVNGGAGYCNAVYVDDVADALILAATREEAVGETFLISAAEPVTWKEFFGAYEKAIGHKATVFMTAEEIERALRHQENGVTPVCSRLRDPRWLLQFEPIQKLYDSIRRWIPCALRDSVKSNVLPRPRFLPDRQRLALFRARTRVRIDKAGRLLGYVPRFDLERGMDLTARFLRWANLV